MRSTRRRLAEAVALAALVTLAGGWLQVSGLAAWLWLAAMTALCLVALLFPRALVTGIVAIGGRIRSLWWSREQGRHHAFAGISLDIVDDGRHVWIRGDDLQRVLRTRDRDDVLAARHAGRWRRADDGGLMLRVDAVVAHLWQAPGRMDPQRQRLRRYLEREVVFPAARRRRRAAP